MAVLGLEGDEDGDTDVWVRLRIRTKMMRINLIVEIFSVEGGCRYIAAELLVGAAASFTYLIKGTQQVLELEALSE